MKRQGGQSIEDVEIHHPGYLIGRDMMYVGYLKGVGRIYHQMAIETRSREEFAKVYTIEGSVC